MKTTSARSLALSSLLAFSKNGKYSNLEVDSTLKKEGAELSDADRGLYSRLVYGVVERVLTLDHIISKYSSRPLSGIDTVALNSLRLGIYQLLYMDRVPDFAAVSESVDLVPKKTRGFVNGVLRSFLRGDKDMCLDGESLSVRYSVSEDVVSVLSESYGAGVTEEILSSFCGDGRVSLRINTLKITVDDAFSRLVDGEHSRYCPDIITVPSLDRTVREGIDEGLWFVQDESSRLAVTALGCRPGDIVADTCAAPGGKSFSSAIDMENRGEIYAFDLHNNKISLIKSGAERLGITVLTAESRDAGEPDGSLAGRCDRVICDAPCSGLGVMAKKPEIRYKSRDEIDRLPSVQLRALKGASTYVKSGGVLVYSTCTLNKRENDGVVEAFLNENGEFEAAEFTVGGMKSEGGKLTVMPHITGTDGFFISKMRRRKGSE